MQLLNDLAAFLANPPGNLVYILAVAFTLIGSLQGAIRQWRISDHPQAGRLVFGLGLLLGIQLVLFVFSGLTEQNAFNGRAILPVLDRAAVLLSLIWIIWLWAFPASSRGGDAATVLMSLLVVAAAVFGSVAAINAGTEAGTFNSTPQALYWSLGGILILVLGLALLFVRKPASWGTGLAMVFLALVGFAWDAAYPVNSGDFSGIIRFFLLAAFPLLLTLTTRIQEAPDYWAERTAASDAPTKVAAVQPTNGEEKVNERARERRRYSTDPKTLQSLLGLAAQVDPIKIDQYIVRSVAQALLVDLCYLIYIEDDKNSLRIATGYDLIREEVLEGGVMSKDDVPMLANAILRGRPLRLPASTTSSDLKGLGDILNLSNPGNLLNVPILSEKGSIGSLLLLSPYSNRIWNADDQTFLTNIASSFVPIVERSRGMNPAAPSLEGIETPDSVASKQLALLRATNEDLSGQVTELQNQLQKAVAEAALQKDLTLLASQPELDSEGLPAKSLSIIPPDGASISQLENELNQTLSEMAHLQNQLSESNNKILILENKSSETMTSEQAEVIASISQELRQPMSSVIGYADLLLGESVGILGALQRKFIERIRTSTERIGSLVDDLIQITTIESGHMAVKAESVDLNLIIDNAMAYTSSQMREKNITLRIDIPEDLKPLHTDRDALQQILIHLLQNAGSASPVEGSVTLRVRMQEEGGNEHVTIQVSDTGGGIPKEDMPRVFSRLYRAENALIQGVGDTGVGLSIAKALTDAQGGRIWVDTELGSGSTFTVSLPVKSAIPGEVPQEA